MVQKLGMVLVIASMVLGAGYGVYHLFAFSFASIALPLKIAIGVFVLGFVLLLIAVGWDRYQTSKKEKF